MAQTAARWKDPAGYPDPKTASGAEWAWEFLRRNPSYRKAFAEAASPLDEVALRAVADRWGLCDACDPDGLLFTCRVFVDRKGYVMLVPPVVFKAQFATGSMEPRNPIDPDELKLFDSYLLEFGIVDADQSLSVEPEEIVWRPEHRNQVALVFDLTHPLRPQIERARRYLEERRQRAHHKRPGLPPLSKVRPKLYATYLRLLDAEFSGATQSEMARTLFPKKDADLGKKNVQNQLRAAKRLRDGAYIHILNALIDPL